MTNTQKQELEVLREKQSAYREQLWHLEGLEKNERLRKYVGKYYIYWNGYSTGDRWPLYSFMKKVGGGYLHAERFEIDSHGQATFNADYATTETLCQEEITKADYIKAFKLFRSQIKTIA